MLSADHASSIAEGLLAIPLPKRWSHTIGVAKTARRLAPILGADAELVEVAAWLHDIGYSPELALTGFHPIDGARYLRDTLACDTAICNLVANHTGAEVEAELRGLPPVRVEFPVPTQLSLDALTYSDMTTDVDGCAVGVDERLAEILGRYGAEHVVSRSVRCSSPMLRATVQRIEDLLRA
ncbi:HD domain-containing protein [Kribbella jejuensis]|uniref:Putative nucleotidyltransferase with HDIG domain n=1 Tax=Kribbella jejuensis TaxID=236068 RepID=A0A542ER39_9ACTN|nr:putative nucleotidyltransferase with HDIG domain [Kribbella jejuensis]